MCVCISNSISISISGALGVGASVSLSASVSVCRFAILLAHCCGSEAQLDADVCICIKRLLPASRCICVFDVSDFDQPTGKVNALILATFARFQISNI